MKNDGQRVTLVGTYQPRQLAAGVGSLCRRAPRSSNPWKLEDRFWKPGAPVWRKTPFVPPSKGAMKGGGLKVLLVDTRQLARVPGRNNKTDPTDCEWIQRLHSCGLLM